MNDIERLLDCTLPFVEDLLKKYGEFYPLASAIKNDDSIAQIGTYNGNDNPLSETVISDLKNGLRAKQDDYKSMTIYYDASVVDPNTGHKTDAITVHVESKIAK